MGICTAERAACARRELCREPYFRAVFPDVSDCCFHYNRIIVKAAQCCIAFETQQRPDALSATLVSGAALLVMVYTPAICRVVASSRLRGLLAYRADAALPLLHCLELLFCNSVLPPSRVGTPLWAYFMEIIGHPLRASLALILSFALHPFRIISPFSIRFFYAPFCLCA